MYRNAIDDPKAERLFLGSTEDLVFSDTMFPTLEGGARYQYSVVATFGGAEAPEALSNVIRKETTSVDALPADGLLFSSDPIRDVHGGGHSGVHPGL